LNLPPLETEGDYDWISHPNNTSRIREVSLDYSVLLTGNGKRMEYRFNEKYATIVNGALLRDLRWKVENLTQPGVEPQVTARKEIQKYLREIQEKLQKEGYQSTRGY